MVENFQQRLDDMDACLKKITCEVRDFDNDLVRRLLLNIKAVKDDRKYKNPGNEQDFTQSISIVHRSKRFGRIFQTSTHHNRL